MIKNLWTLHVYINPPLFPFFLSSFNSNKIMVNANNSVKDQQTKSKHMRSGSFNQSRPKVLRPFNTNEVKVLLLENINETAIASFKKQGYQVYIYIYTHSFIAVYKPYPFSFS